MSNQRSLEYVKSRIRSGTTGLTDCIYDSMFEVSPINFLPKDCNNSQLWVNEYNGNGKIISELHYDNGKIISELHYDIDTDFNYFTMSRNINDGTLLFMQTVIEDVLNRVMTAATCNKKIMLEVPNDKDFLNSHHIKYTIGNIVCCSEYSEKFATNEKPYLTSRYTAILPIKFEIVKD